MHKKILEKEILKDGVLKNKNAKRKKQIKMNEKTLEKKKKSHENSLGLPPHSPRTSLPPLSTSQPKPP